MTPQALLHLIARDGARLALTPSGRLRLIGDQVQIERWALTVKQYEDELRAALQAEASR